MPFSTRAGAARFDELVAEKMSQFCNLFQSKFYNYLMDNPVKSSHG